MSAPTCQLTEFYNLPESAFDQAIEALYDWANRPDAALWFAMCLAEGSKPTLEALS